MYRRRIISMIVALALPLAACSADRSEEAAGPDETTSPGQGHLFVAGDARSLALAEQRAYEHIFDRQHELLDGVWEVWTRGVQIDELNMGHTRLKQTFDNIPVFGAEGIVHMNPDGGFRFMTDSFVRHIDVSTTPLYSDMEALDLAVAAAGGWRTVTGTPDVSLFVLRHEGADHLTYRVSIDQFEPDQLPAMPVVFIDAHDGALVTWYDNLMSDRSRRTHDANAATSLPGTLRRSEGDDLHGDEQIDNAHDFAGIAYDYMFTVHGRNSFDDLGATIISTVHYGNNYVNAFWNGIQVVYGDGDGVRSGPLAVDDVVYHEITHALTQKTAGLIYQNESGALNEATSDIMAAAIESWAGGSNPWWIGEDCWTPDIPDDALRYMDDPTRDNVSRDHYSTRYVGPANNGGVHWNSGIGNLFFYLLSEGGDHPKAEHRVNTVNGIGVERAAKIWYRALTVYMTASTNFAAAREATTSACADLYDDMVCASVAAAWNEVGVGYDGGGSATCKAKCGGPSSDASCYCDFWCLFFNDCCTDYISACF